MSLVTFLLVIFSIFLISMVIVNRRPKGYPPGPFITFPIVGHLPFSAFSFGKGFHVNMMALSRRLGPVVSVDGGTVKIVVICDPKMIREAWNLPELSGRVHFPINLIRSGTDGVQRGIIFADGQNWVEQRRFIVRHLRDFGLGKTSMESIIMAEVQELVQRIGQNAGHPVSTQFLFNPAVINAIWAIVAGERFQHDDPKLAKLVECVTQNLSDTGSVGVLIFFHWLTKHFPNATGWNKYLDSFYLTHNFIRNFVETRQKAHDENLITDFTAAYIDKVNNTTDQKSTFYGEEGIRNLVTVLDDLFSAGGETTSTTLSSLTLYLAMHPQVQDKFYAEIALILGTNRLPTLVDKARMPYTEAVICETLRLSTVVSSGVPHSPLENVTFRGYFIPKNTMVISNLHAAHHDPEIWGDPEVFRPERFLSSDGKSVLKHEAFMPFSTGKRICPGEALAKDEIFLIGVTVVQKFRIGPDPFGPKLSLNQKVNGLVSTPLPHRLVFLER